MLLDNFEQKDTNFGIECLLDVEKWIYFNERFGCVWFNEILITRLIFVERYRPNISAGYKAPNLNNKLILELA